MMLWFSIVVGCQAEMYLKGRSVPLRRSRRRSPWAIILLLLLIIAALLMLGLQMQGRLPVRDPFLPTATPTRSPVSWAEEAKTQFSFGKFDRAIEAYRQALVVDQRNVGYWVGLARVQIFAGRYADAIESAESALVSAPDSARARAVYAWALWYEDRVDEAQAAAVQAIAIDANYAPARAYYSFILNSTFNLDQGFGEAQKALELDPTLIESHLALGFSNEVVGNYDGAIDRYQDALAINPNIIETYRKIAFNYRAKAQRASTKLESDTLMEQALIYFGKALSLDPNNVLPYLDLSRTNIQIDRLGVAQQYLNQALDLEPDNPLIHGRLGLLYFKRRNYESAEPSLRLAIEGGPYEYTVGLTQTLRVNVAPLPLADGSTLEFYYTYGNLLAFLGRCAPDEAPLYLQKALDYEPDNETVIASYEESVNGICRRVLAGEQPSGGAGTPTPTP
jgi:tetratricopeptide (TPR) repeat protein